MPVATLISILTIQHSSAAGYKIHTESAFGLVSLYQLTLLLVFIVHLLLKIRFGLRSFKDREDLITDGTNDGGIDAYYISHASHTIYFIQSKFRNTEQNFDGGKGD